MVNIIIPSEFSEDRSMDELKKWFIEAFKHPLSPLFLFLGAVLILLGVSNGFSLPGLKEVAPDAHSRGISVLIGIACCVFAVWLYYHPPSESLAKSTYNVFLSTPMAAYENDEQYKASRKEFKKVFDTLQAYDSKVFWASEKIESISDFQTKSISATIDLEAIKKSKYFCLIYREKLVTSAIFEAGYAHALNKFSIYFVKQKNDLPFLMRDLPNVRIHDSSEWTTTEQMITIIHDYQNTTFKK
jgi:hypothetical protein